MADHGRQAGCGNLLTLEFKEIDGHGHGVKKEYPDQYSCHDVQADATSH
jgi:hypothetical protein